MAASKALIVSRGRSSLGLVGLDRSGSAGPLLALANALATPKAMHTYQIPITIPVLKQADILQGRLLTGLCICKRRVRSNASDHCSVRLQRTNLAGLH